MSAPRLPAWKASRYREWFLSAIRKEPFDYQLDILTRNRPMCINKARQIGVSTALACLAVVYAGLGGKKVLIASKDLGSSVHILNDYCWDFLRPMLEGGIISKPTTDQRTLLQWDNGGEIRSVPARAEHARGYPVDLLILDEFAHFTQEEGLDKKMKTALVPTLAQRGGWGIYCSTPNGTVNEFYRMWTDPEFPAADKITIPYTDCPTLKVRKDVRPFGTVYFVGETGKEVPFDEDSFRQEFMNDFFVGSNEAILRTALYAALVESDEGAWG